jgi:hypothetical protein
MGRRGRVLCVLVAGLAALAGCGPNESAAKTSPTAGASWPSSEGLDILRAHLHQDGSGAEARRLFPDLVQTYVDDGHGKQDKIPPAILPYKYYWSPSGRFTVSICSIEKTVFICPYYLDGLIKPWEFPSCDVSSNYSVPELAPTPPPVHP